jgi:catechol 2,3-dioxygenase-like lactoylglutathione lyase family enzyme
MQVSHIDTVFLWVCDLDRAVAWYRDRLGIEPGRRYGAWQSMTLEGETVFALHQGRGGHAAVNAVVGFRVDDLDGAIATLAASGIEPVDADITDTGYKRFTTFSDPDGNHIQLVELA